MSTREPKTSNKQLNKGRPLFTQKIIEPSKLMTNPAIRKKTFFTSPEEAVAHHLTATNNLQI